MGFTCTAISVRLLSTDDYFAQIHSGVGLQVAPGMSPREDLAGGSNGRSINTIGHTTN